MNFFLIIILSTLVIEFVISIISGFLTVKSLSSILPSEFVGAYDEDKYQKSQRYTRDNIRFSRITSTVNLLVIISVILLGGFELVDSWTRGITMHPVWDGLLFMGILYFIQDIISLPFSIYHTFVIEEKYGFNKMTPSLFIKDKLKAYLLLAILGTIILGAILSIFESLGSEAWFVAWCTVTLITIVIQPLYIHFIAPLFNKFVPLEDGELKSLLEKYAVTIKFPLSGIFVMDGSKRSTHSNAYFTGFGKNKRIVLYDTLIKEHSPRELLTILAHEIGHYKKHHILKGMLLSITHTGMLLFLLSLFLNNQLLFDAFKMTHVSVYASILFFGLLYSPIELILALGLNALSRKHEFEADRFAVETTTDGDSFIRGLKQLSAHNLSNLTPHPFTVFISYSHPPVLKRISEIRNNSLNSSYITT
ncbi:MAG: M48 family metallopeptidase [Candidatus Marinimicrobia bacterium]|nr:M48 family metallopeptidase [Candidatus Neomarinimicrobiota bacterium]